LGQDPDSNGSNSDAENGNNDSSDEDDDSGRSTSEIVRDVALIMLVGVALIVGLVCSTYGFAMISDKLCCCCPWFRPVTNMAEFEANFDRGPVARKARLWGLTLEERAQVLQAFFKKRIFLYDKDNIHKHELEKEKEQKDAEVNADGVDVEKGEVNSKELVADVKDDEVETNEQPAVEPAAETPESDNAEADDEEDKPGSDDEKDEDAEASVEATTNDVESGNGEKEDVTEAKDEKATDTEESEDKKEGDADDGDDDEVLDDADHERICCICLNEYVKDDQLITGSQCIHKTHYACCMEWMKKHDHCPYCRQEMLTASQMRKTAQEVLGEARVKDLGAAAAPPAVTEPTMAAVPDGEPADEAPATPEEAAATTEGEEEGDIEMGSTNIEGANEEEEEDEDEENEPKEKETEEDEADKEVNEDSAAAEEDDVEKGETHTESQEDAKPPAVEASTEEEEEK